MRQCTRRGAVDSSWGKCFPVSTDDGLMFKYIVVYECSLMLSALWNINIILLHLQLRCISQILVSASSTFRLDATTKQTTTKGRALILYMFHDILPRFSTSQGSTSVSPTTARYVWPRDRKRGCVDATCGLLAAILKQRKLLSLFPLTFSGGILQRRNDAGECKVCSGYLYL